MYLFETLKQERQYLAVSDITVTNHLPPINTGIFPVL